MDWSNFKPDGPSAGVSSNTDWGNFVPEKPVEQSGFLRRAADVPLGLAKGVADLPGAAVGILDTFTGGTASNLVIDPLTKVLGEAADSVGMPSWARPTQWAKSLSDLYSPEAQAALKASNAEAKRYEELAKQNGDGGWGQIYENAKGQAVGLYENPAAAVPLITENWAGMKAIAGVVKRILKPMAVALDVEVKAGKITETAANKALSDAAVKYAAAGEGVLTTGQVGQTIQRDDPNADFMHRLAAVPAGAITAGISRGVGKIPGLGDAEASMAMGALKKEAGFAGTTPMRAAKGFLSEGILQEGTQSPQEEIWGNIGASKPWQEGVGASIVQGIAAGGPLGAYAGVRHGDIGGHAISEEEPSAPPPPPPPPASILDASNVDAAIKTFGESLTNTETPIADVTPNTSLLDSLRQTGQQWRDLEVTPTGDVGDIAAHKVGQQWQDIAPEQSGSLEQQRLELEQAAAARSRARDAQLASMGKQWQDLGITNPADDLQAQKMGMREEPNGTSDSVQSVPVGRSGDDGVIPTAGVATGMVDDQRRGNDQTGRDADSVGQSGELPGEVPQRPITPTYNPQPTSLGTQITATAGPGFTAKDVYVAQVEQARPEENRPLESPAASAADIPRTAIPGMVEARGVSTTPASDPRLTPVSKRNQGSTTNGTQTAQAQQTETQRQAPAATDSAKPATSDGVATANEAGNAPGTVEVSRYNGKFGKGMNRDAARLEAQRLNKTNDGITYTAEEHNDPKLENPYAVVGRKASAPDQMWKDIVDGASFENRQKRIDAEILAEKSKAVPDIGKIADLQETKSDQIALEGLRKVTRPSANDSEQKQAVTLANTAQPAIESVAKPAKAKAENVVSGGVNQSTTLPPALSAKLQEAHKAHGRDVTLATVQKMYDRVMKTLITGKGNNGGVQYDIKPKDRKELQAQADRLTNDLSLFGAQEPANPLDVPTDAQTQDAAYAAVDALTDDEAIAVAQRMGKKIPARGDAKDAIKREHPDDIAKAIAGETWDGKDWKASTPTEATPTPESKYKGPSDVSSRSGQMELANRAGTIAALKGMNAQLRSIAPNEAWADKNIEESNDLDGLRDKISTALVNAGKPAPETTPDANPGLRAKLEELSGAELKDIFAKLNLAGKHLMHSERVEMLLQEDANEVEAAINGLQPESKPASEMSASELLRAAADKMDSVGSAFPRTAQGAIDAFNADDSEQAVAMFSRSTTPPSSPFTIAQARAAVGKRLSKVLAKLEAKGLVTLVQTEQEAIDAAARAVADKTGEDIQDVKASLLGDADIKRSADGRIQGFYVPETKQAYLIADNLTAKTTEGVLMHEVGVHMAADGSMVSLFSRALELVKIGGKNPFMQRVSARMAKAGETSGEEAAAYISEEYENDQANAPGSVQNWVASVYAAVRAWMFRKGIIIQASNLTPADIAAVARANAKSLADGSMQAAGSGFDFSHSMGDEKLLAPNGKPSKLTPGQYAQVRTPEFKRWFGDWENDPENASKAVDENGEPLVVYHGGTVGNVFDASHNGTGSGREGGFFFTPDIRQARDYAGSANVKTVYLNIKNPLFTDSQLGSVEVMQAKADSHDGYWVIEDGLVQESEIVVFNPTQIKSAIGNNGQFDPKNPDIRFSRAAAPASIQSSVTDYAILNDPPAQEALAVQSGVEGKSAVEAAQFVADNAPSESHRAIAAKVALRLQQMEDVGKRFTFNVVHVGDQAPSTMVGNGIRGQVIQAANDPVTHIWVQGADVHGKVGVSFETVLHELLHAATQKAIDLGGHSGTGELSLYAGELRSAWRSILLHIKAKADAGQSLNDFEKNFVSRKNNSLENIHELVSWALTNKETQDYLETIPYKKSNVWNEFVASIRRFLGLKKDAETVLSEILRVSDKLLSVDAGVLMLESMRQGVHMQVNYASTDANGRGRSIINSSLAASIQSSVTDTLKAVTSPLGTVSLWDKTVGTKYNLATKDKDFKRVFDAFRQQTDDTAHYAIEAEKLAPDVLLRMDSMKDVFGALFQHSLSKQEADLKAIAGPLFANIEGEKGIKQVRYTDAQLAQQFKLTPKQILMYHQVRGAVDTSIDRLAQTFAAQMGQTYGMDIATVKNYSLEDTVEAVKQYIQDEHDNLRGAQAQAQQVGAPKISAPTVDDTKALLTRLDQMEQHATFLKDSGYMPAMRFGEFAVTVLDANDEVEAFHMFDTKTEAKLAAMKLRKKYPGSRVESSVMNPKQFAMFKGVSPETVELFAKFTGMDSNADVQQYIALSKSARSVAQRELQRKGTAGFSEDVTRVLASFLTSNARQAAINMNQGDVTDALSSKALARKGDVQVEAQKLDEYMSNPIEEARRLRGFMFMHFIGGSFASAIVNLTQPVMQTTPYLHQFAGAKTARIMAAAATMAATGKIDNQQLRDAAKRAAEDGITEPNEIHALMADAGNTGLGSNIKVRAIIKAWGGLFSATEAYNRRLTFLAAYQTAMETNQADPYAFAQKAVIETQGLYSKVNRPNWARGAVGATVFTFKQFSIAYMEFLSRLPVKQKLLALTILTLAAGLQGLPGADDLEDLIDTLGQSLGYNINSKKWLRKKLIDALGKDIGTVLDVGVLSALSAVDVQGRLGMGNLIPGTALFKPSETDKSRSMAELAGPIAGLLTSAQKAVTRFQTGDTGGAFQEMAPVSIKSLLKGIEMANTGAYKDAKGYKVTAVTAADSFIKMLGFQPSDVAMQTRLLGEELQSKNMTTLMESLIAERMAQGYHEKDFKKVAEARRTLNAWNENNPDSRIVINPNQIRSRVVKMEQTRAQRFLKTVPKEQRRQVAEELS